MMYALKKIDREILDEWYKRLDLDELMNKSEEIWEKGEDKSTSEILGISDKAFYEFISNYYSAFSYSLSQRTKTTATVILLKFAHGSHDINVTVKEFLTMYITYDILRMLLASKFRKDVAGLPMNVVPMGIPIIAESLEDEMKNGYV